MTKATLGVLAAIHKGAEYIMALDLPKYFDLILKLTIRGKLDENIDNNLANELIIFLLTAKARVTGDISDAEIEIIRGLTQGGTSSPALFKLFI